MTQIKVLIVDDSAVARQGLTAALSQDPGIRVIGAVADPLLAMTRMHVQWPDVMVLDVEMPRVNGIAFLKKLMAEHPTPVVVCSAISGSDMSATERVILAGAVSVIAKPRMDLKQFFQDESDRLVLAVKSAAQANLRRKGSAVVAEVSAKLTADAVLSAPLRAVTETTSRIIAIGASTGGTKALELLLTALPSACPGIVIVQHMPGKFTGAFAVRLNGLCQIDVREAVDGDKVLPGCALIAPGGHHMLLKRNGAQYSIQISDGPLVARHCPSVDVLFRSVAKCAGKNALGIIMTGMGDDGAKGLKEMHDMGATTLGQDEASCIVYGMPREALKLGAVDQELPLSQIAHEILVFGGRR